MSIPSTKYRTESIRREILVPALLVVLLLSFGFNVGIQLWSVKKTLVLFIALAGGTGISLLILWRPFIGVWLTGFFLPLEIYQRILPAYLTIGKTLAFLTFLGWLLNKLRTNDFSLKRATGFVPLLLIVGTTCISVLVARNKGLAIAGAIQVISFLLLYVLMVELIETKDQLRLIINTILIVVFFISVFGFAQWATKSPLGKGLTLRDAKEWQAMRIYEFTETGKKVYRIIGTFKEPNDYAGYLCLIMFLALAMTVTDTGKFTRLLFLVLFFLLSANLLFTYSRSGYIAAGVTFFIFLMHLRKRVMFILLIPLILIVGLTIVPPEYTERFKTIFSYSSVGTAQERMLVWRLGLKLAWDNLLLGVGPHNFPIRVAEYDFRVLDAHNNFIRWFAESGILGLLSLLSFLGVYYYRITKTLLRTQPDKYIKVVLQGILMGTFSYFAMGMFIVNIYKPHIWYFLGLGASAMIIMHHHKTTDSFQSHVTETGSK